MRFRQLEYFPLAILAICLPSLSQAATEATVRTVEVLVPEHPAEGEVYLCTRVPLPATSQRLVGIEPLSKEEVVHHMLLYGCAGSSGSQEPVWECVGHGICGEPGQEVLYGWGKNAPAMVLPPGVGFHVGEGSAIHSLVLQVHYLSGRPKDDTSGVRLALTADHMPFSAGMLMYASAFSIPPGRQSTLVPNRCCLRGFEPAHGFAFRVHTHALGRMVWLDRLEQGLEHRLVEYSPQLPQGFTPVDNITFWPGETLQATCEYDSRTMSHAVRSGATHHDEMCNLYFMMWTELPIFITCFNHFSTAERHGPGGIPKSASLVPEADSHWQPPLPRASPGPPSGPASLGQVSGVAKGHNGTLWVLHRGTRVWDGATFEGGGAGERTTYTDAIDEDTVLQLDQDTGEVLSSWGAGALYMPHMITVDRDGHVWVVDVALHQAIKFSATGQKLLELGKHLEPGHDDGRLCKPTHVAVTNNGTIYVGDGYCNARVVQYGPDGTWQGNFELDAPGKTQIPHSLAVDECQQVLYVAYREAAVVHMFDLASRVLKGTWDLKQHGMVYAIAIGPYGAVLALCWNRDAPGSPSSLVLLGPDPEAGLGGVWPLEGAQAPHDLALVAAPLRLAGRERPLAVLVGETRPSGSSLRKYLLLPPGVELPEDDGSERFVSASKSWQHILSTPPSSNPGAPPHAAGQVQAALAQEQDRAHGAGHHHARARSLRVVSEKSSRDTITLRLQGWGESWLAWLLYGGGSSMIEVEEQDERSGLGFDVNSAFLVSIPLCVLALMLAVLLWRLAAPSIEAEPCSSGSERTA